MYSLAIQLYLFIGCIYLSVFVTVLGLSLVMVSGGYSLVAVHRLLIVVTSLAGMQILGHAGSSNCGVWA